MNYIKILRSLLKLRLININKTRNIFSRRFDLNDHHLVKTINQISNSENINYKDTEIYKYHKEFCPTNQIVALGLESCINVDLKLFQNPWGSTKKKNFKNSQFCGPTRNELIKKEFIKLKKLYNSIKKNGFKYFSRNGVLGGYFLHSINGNSTFIVTQGNHRLSVLSYLGYKYILVYTMKGYIENIYEKDVDDWPLVKNGFMSTNDALTIFNMYFKYENS